MHHIYNIKLY
ncbi:hypothetical protein [Plasmodium yoelii yoelii]|uniref:Uncharacterized protein n=1 Tax=Plasmodium yoelii yoelii TaxID=73239 RepID=Q7RGV8_PLAYO|nr:hypothetical protein [Plasmodium yoelii yoelii]